MTAANNKAPFETLFTDTDVHYRYHKGKFAFTRSGEAIATDVEKVCEEKTPCRFKKKSDKSP